MVTKTRSPKSPAPRKPISEKTLQAAAARLIPQGKLVSTEISYLQSVLAPSAPQEEIDAKVIEVRKMPWASLNLS